jgi:hypothetical protein
MTTVKDTFTADTLIKLRDNGNWSILDAACQRDDVQPQMIEYLVDIAVDSLMILFENLLLKSEDLKRRKEDKIAAKEKADELLKFFTLCNLPGDYAARYATIKISHEIRFDLLKYIEEAPDSSFCAKVLEGPFIKAVLNQKAIEVPCLSILFIELFLQMLTVFAFSFSFIREDVKVVTSQELSFCILGVSLFWFGLREILQLSSSFNIRCYFNDPSNFLDLAQLVLIFVVLLTHAGAQGKHQESLFLVCILVSWFRLIFMFGNLVFNVAVFASALVSVSFVLPDALFSYNVHFC